MKRVLNGWIFSSVMLLAAGGQLCSSALAAWAMPVRRALGTFDITLGGAMLALALLAKAAARHAVKQRTEVERKIRNAEADWLKEAQ